MFEVISLENLKRITPSIFTTEGGVRTSEKYKHISTIEVVNGLMSQGFMPVKAIQSNSRKAGKAEYTKHMMRFRHIDACPTSLGLYPEIVLINSHDGLSSYRLMAGIYRVVCSNGLIAGNTHQEIRIRHQGDIVNNVINGTFEVMKESKKLLEHADHMGGITLTHTEKLIFAEAAHQLRFDGSDSSAKDSIKPEQFLEPRRNQDVRNDLFTVFNVIQENVIRGGVYTRIRNRKGRMRTKSTREIKSIDQNNSLNRALWSLAEKMMELKSKK